MANRHFIFSIAFTLYILLSLTSVAYSQPSSGTVLTLNVDNGMEGLNVEHFFIDSKKLLWVKTEKGINIYDDADINFYKYTKEHDEIHSQNKLAFFIEKDDDVCLYYEKESKFYDLWDRREKKFIKKRLNYEQPNVGFYFDQWIKDKSGEVWALFTVKEKNKLIQHQLINIVSNKKINFITQNPLIKITSGRDGFWIMNNRNQVFGLNLKGEKSIVPLPSQLVKNTQFIDQILHILYEDREGRLWVSFLNRNGLFYKTKEEDKLHIYRSAYNNQTFTNLWEDSTGKILFGTSKSQRYTSNYYLLDKEFVPWSYLSSVNIIPTDVFSEDFYKEMFIGSYRALKILYLKKDFITNLLCDENIKAGKYGATIMSICSINDSTILLLDERRSLYLLDKKTKSIRDTLTFDIGKVFHLKSVVIDTANHTIWLHIHTGKNHKSGLLSYHLITKKQQIHPIDSKISALYFDQEHHQLLIAGYNDSEKHILKYSSPFHKLDKLVSIKDSSKREGRILSMHLDNQKDKLWFTKDNSGLFYYDFEKDSIYPTMLSEEINYNHIAQRKDGSILVSSFAGVYFINQKGEIIYHWNKKNGMKNTSVCYVVEDEDGKIWASSFSGIHVFNTNTIQGNIGIEDGLCFSEYNQRSGYKDKEGLLYLGGANGVTIIDPQIYNQYSRNIKLEYVKLHDDIIDTTLFNPNFTIELHQSDNESINIKLLNSKLSVDDDFSYLYRCLPDKTWIVSTSNTIVLSKLNTGKHTIEIKGMSRMGLSSENILKIPVTVYQKLIEKFWFQLLIWSIFLSLLFYLLFRYISHKRIVKIKQEFEITKKMASYELEALRSQLNPHFIFNSMGAIQHYIGQHETRKAQVYLSDFSRLMRLFLESSKVKFVSINDELEMLKLYIKLEQLRFNNSFIYDITVENGIALNELQIPSLLLQPFVENAINHGLAHIQNQGNLKINIVNDGSNSIVISIIDNGVGREESRIINSKSLYKPKSRGMDLIKNRIELLSKTQNFKVEIHTVDLFDEDQTSRGFRVDLKFPLYFD